MSAARLRSDLRRLRVSADFDPISADFDPISAEPYRAASAQGVCPLPGRRERVRVRDVRLWLLAARYPRLPAAGFLLLGGLGSRGRGGGLLLGALAAAFQAGLEGLHQIDDLGGGLLGRGGLELLALHLAVDVGQHPLLHLVLVFARLEGLAGDLIDQLVGQLQLGVAHLGHVGHRHLGDVPHLVGVQQLLHHQAVAAGGRTDHHQVLLAPGGVAGQRRPPALAHHLGQQVVRLLPALLRRHVIRLVEVDRVHLVQRDELGDVHRLAGPFLQGLQLVGREHHVLVLGELVALHHVLARDDHFLARAQVLLLQPRAARLVEQVERDPAPLRLRGRVQLDRDGDQAERDARGSDGSRWHVGIYRSM